MHNLGHTRSSLQPNHLLLTPDTFVRTPLPGMKGCVAVVHAGPALGARFTQYTAEMEAGGEMGPTSAQRFFFVLEGQSLEADRKRSNSGPRGYAYAPEVLLTTSWVLERADVTVIEKSYEAVSGGGAAPI